MDPVTHTLVGAVTAQAFFKKKVGPCAVPILCWSSNLPDIDTLVLLTRDPGAITMRRSIGHSVFLFPLWCAGLAWLLRRFYPQAGYWTTFGLCLVGAALHVFFDLVNSFGVVALWPFSMYRPELAIIFIIDLTLTGILLAPFIATRLKSWQGRLKQACRVSIALASAYVLFCAGARMRAEVLLMNQSAGVKPSFSYVFPEPFGPLRWRGVLRLDDMYRVYLINVVTGSVEIHSLIPTDEGVPAVGLVRRASPMARRLEAFFKAPVWRAGRSAAGNVEVAVYDLRFRPVLLARGKPFEFQFEVLSHDYVREIGWLGRGMTGR